MSTETDNSFLDWDAFQVFPNPTSAQIHINAKERMIQSMDLFDLSGRAVWSQHTIPQGAYSEMDLSFLEAGTYVLRLQAGQKTGMRKVVVQ